MLGIVIISKLWPTIKNKNFQELGYLIAGEKKQFLKVKDKPIIGINQEYAFRPEKFDWNNSLIEEMVKQISSDIDELFLGIHDTHFKGEKIDGFEEYLFNIPPELELHNMEKGTLIVLFKHERYSELNRILETHKDTFYQNDFVNEINNYINKIKKKCLYHEISKLRYKILEPLVALDLLYQVQDRSFITKCADLLKDIQKRVKEIEDSGNLRKFSILISSELNNFKKSLYQTEVAIGYELDSKFSNNEQIVINSISKIENHLTALNMDSKTIRFLIQSVKNKNKKNKTIQLDDLKEYFKKESYRLQFPEYTSIIEKAIKGLKIDHNNLERFALRLEKIINEFAY